MKMIIILIAVLALVVAVIFALGFIFSGPVYNGPSSEHFDGKKFRNIWGVEANKGKDLWRWFRTREPGIWKAQMDLPYGPAPAARIDGDSLAVTFVNHSTFLIQTRGLNILTDPVWSKRASPVSFAGPKRMRPPGIRIEDLPDIDIVLLTHNHYDHLDVGTLKRLWDEYEPVVYCPLGVGKYLQRRGIEKVVEMDWWDESAVDGQLRILCTPAQHFSGRGMFDRDRTLWSGFALLTNSGSIYYAGDTGYGTFFRDIANRISPIRLSFIPIGAYKPEWFMSPIHTSPEDALRIHRELASPVSIAMHYGTFPLADDSQGEPEREVLTLMREMGVEEDEFLLLEEGRVKVFNLR